VTPKPLAVYDVHEPGWQNLPTRARDRVNDWARSEGLNPEDIYRLETYLIDCPFVRVYAITRDGGGNIILGDDGTSLVTLTPRDAPVSSLPPVNLWKTP